MLRRAAEAMEEMGRVAEITDRAWRIVYMSSEQLVALDADIDVADYYGLSVPQRDVRDRDLWAVDEESARRWWRLMTPYMRYTLEPDAPQFAGLAESAARYAPVEPPPVWGTWTTFARTGLAYTPSQYLMYIRLDEPGGEFAGALMVSWPRLPGAVLGLLSRGDTAMFERMARMAEPHRCETAILFVDLEASGELSRALSSRAYFELVRTVTSLFDDAVIEHVGIVGRHAGDGASAFFCPPDFDGSRSRAAAAAIAAARRVREQLAGIELGGGVRPTVNAGIHWGSTVMMGQVVTGGRLEITALGDEVNETARIEAAARGGVSLASKHLLERLDPPEAAGLGLDPDTVAYCALSAIDGVDAKAVRDAGSIAVTEV